MWTEPSDTATCSCFRQYLHSTCVLLIFDLFSCLLKHTFYQLGHLPECKRVHDWEKDSYAEALLDLERKLDTISIARRGRLLVILSKGIWTEIENTLTQICNLWSRRGLSCQFPLEIFRAVCFSKHWQLKPWRMKN